MRSRSVPTSARNSLMSYRTPRAEVRITPASATPTVTMAIISGFMLPPSWHLGVRPRRCLMVNRAPLKLDRDRVLFGLTPRPKPPAPGGGSVSQP